MEEQGYNMKPLLLYQDNMSAILLKTNGKASSSKRTKHIKVKYSFIKEKVDNGEIVIEHCPTEQMWMDINTKLKQGKVFCKFQGHVMGIPADYNDDDYRKDVVTIPPVSTMLPIPRAKESLQECVGGNLIGPRGKQRNEQSPVHSNLTATRPKEECLNAGVQAPIKIVDGRHWSPGVYRNLRLMGFTLEVAWARALISLLLLNLCLQSYTRALFSHP
jgi:hypothetical protein